MIDTVRVPLGRRSYDVVIGRGLLDQAGERMYPLLDQPSVAVISALFTMNILAKVPRDIRA